MKTKQQLDQLSAKVTEAERNYYQAIENHLLELGHPVSVQEEGNEERGISLSIMDGSRIYTGIYDQIRCLERGCMQVHCTFFEYKNTDDWLSIYELGDAAAYLLESIQWQE